jgi:hypothetical protein
LLCFLKLKVEEIEQNATDEPTDDFDDQADDQPATSLEAGVQDAAQVDPCQ